MADNTYRAPSEYLDADPAPDLLPTELWSFMYLVHGPNVLNAAVKVNPSRVAEIFASQQSSNVSVTVPTPESSSKSAHPLRISPPSITPFDGHPSNLRAFCSQLVNQMQIFENQFNSEIDKVRFAYQCLGPGALSKMRSSFRCLEDPTVPAEILTLDQFMTALRQRCQDPGLVEKSTRIIDTLHQNNMRFHDFITVFEDNMTDSTYGHLGKDNWKVMLERRLSKRLRNALVMAHGVPKDYNQFVTYLRNKDAAFHEINSTESCKAPRYTPPQARTPKYSPFLPSTQATNDKLVSQGGSAMDLDKISEQKGLDGKLTQQARDARFKLRNCFRCNQPGHIARNCPLGNHSISSIISDERPESELSQLKEQLQQ